MKRFAFRLERIRELRERAERERAAELGAALAEERARAAAVARASEQLARAGEQAATAGADGVPAGLWHNLGLARDAAAERLGAADEALREASAGVAEHQERYGEARRDLRVIEKLKEKRFDAWREAGAREEQKETDEVARDRHITKEDRP